MQIFRVYTRPRGSTKGKPKLRAMHYRAEDAAAHAGRLALEGLWVRVTTNEEADPSRWD